MIDPEIERKLKQAVMISPDLLKPHDMKATEAQVRMIVKDRMTPAVQRMQKSLEAFTRASIKAAIANAVLAACIKMPWGDRITQLLCSKDRRQRKRGRRLADQWTQQHRNPEIVQ